MKAINRKKVWCFVLVAGLVAISFTPGFSYVGNFLGKGWDYLVMGSGSEGCTVVYNSGDGVALGLRADNNDALWCNGSATFDGSIVSTVDEGAQPIDVASTTLCTNLNADTVDGYHVATNDPNQPQLCRRQFFSIPGGGTNTSFDIPAMTICTVSIGSPGTADGVAFLHILESHGSIVWNGQDGNGNPVVGNASLSSVTSLVTFAYDSVWLETPGDGSRRIIVRSLGSEVHGMCIW